MTKFITAASTSAPKANVCPPMAPPIATRRPVSPAMSMKTLRLFIGARWFVVRRPEVMDTRKGEAFARPDSGCRTSAGLPVSNRAKVSPDRGARGAADSRGPCDVSAAVLTILARADSSRRVATPLQSRNLLAGDTTRQLEKFLQRGTRDAM